MAVSDLTVESHSRNERRRARNRDALVAASRRLFVQHGFEATTIAGIAEEADLGFGTFYRYFPDKEAALVAVLQDAMAEMDEVVLAEDDATVPPAEALAHLVERFVHVGRKNRDLVALWWQMSLRRNPLHEQLMAAPQLPVRLTDAVERIVVRGVAAGAFRAGDVQLTAQFIASGLMFVLTPISNDTDADRVASGLATLAFAAVGADAGNDAGGAAGRGV
jgi:AcrR family transcriptional regulator